MIGTFSVSRFPRIVFGAGALGRLPELVARYGTRVLLVTGRSAFVNTPHLETLQSALAGRGIERV